MFATMVVQLPSAHQGGQLQVFKDGENNPVIHGFGAAAGTAEYQCHYAVHYADAEHAVTPITKGYRLALIYSICWPATTTLPAPSMFTAEKQELMRKPLATLADANREFHYYFKHAYTPKSMAELGVNSLKGQDRARVESLLTANDSLPPDQRFKFYLLRGERRDSYYAGGYSYHTDDWEKADGPDYSFGPLLSLDGRQLNRQNLVLDDADVLIPDNETRAERWRGHRTTTYEGYLGNEGPTKRTLPTKSICCSPGQPSLQTAGCLR
jgi:hypothetical protein